MVAIQSSRLQFEVVVPMVVVGGDFVLGEMSVSEAAGNV